MNINKIKQNIIELKNENLKIKVNLGRNKYEYYDGKIISIYPNIFVVKTNRGIKSFSYSDIAIKSVIISKFN